MRIGDSWSIRFCNELDAQSAFIKLLADFRKIEGDTQLLEFLSDSTEKLMKNTYSKVNHIFNCRYYIILKEIPNLSIFHASHIVH